MVTTTADLNLHPDLNGNVKIFCSQYDNALREIVFNIYDGDTLADLSDLTAKVEGTKPDKYGYSYDATIRTSNSTVTVTLVTQMTCVAGLSHAEIVLYDDDSRVGTANFLLMVEEAGISDDTIVSDSVIPGIHNIDTLVEYAQTYADNAEASALEAEGYAAGTQNGTEVESGSEYYEHNAKYYCEQAWRATPEAYAELVEQVQTNTTDISNTKSVIGSSYNASTNYAVGDRFTDNGVRYKVNVPCTGITPPNANYYEVLSVDEDTKELESEIDTLNSSLTNLLSNLGAMQSASWTATAASDGTLTNSLTLEAGTYIMELAVPYSSDTTTTMLAGIDGPTSSDEYTYAYCWMASSSRYHFLIKLNGTRTVRGMASGSSSLTFDSSYLNRGGLRTIRIC